MSGSETPDEGYAATLVAEGLIEAAAAFGQHRRLYLAECFGLAPDQVFEALKEYIEPIASPMEVTAADGSSHIVQAIDLQATAGRGGYLVPYLVTTGAGSNTGTAGFAAFLRDALPPAHAGRPTVLLVLHRNPVETVKTAAQDAGELPELGWQRLLGAAVDGAPAEVKRLLVEAIDLAGERLPRSATTVGRLRRLAASGDVAAAGSALHELGPFVSDPAAAASPRARLKGSMKWRQDLDAWSSPDEDLDARLRPRYESAEEASLERIVAAKGPFGLDYSAFTYDDLPVAGQVQPARLAHPLRIRGAAAATTLNRAAVWKPGGGTVGLALAAPASRREAVTVRWSDGATEEVQLEPGAVEVSLEVAGDAWRYASIQMSGGQAAVLALSTSIAEWAPVEVNLDIDPVVGAFRCGEQPQVVALAASSAILGQASVSATPEADGERHEVTAEFSGALAVIHLLVTPRLPDGEPDPGDPDPGPVPGPDGPGEPGGGDDPEDDPEREDPPRLAGAAVPTGAHAIIVGSRDGAPIDIDGFLILEDGDAIFSPFRYQLQSQDLGGGLDGLALERAIVATPKTLAFTLTRAASGDIEVQPHPYLCTLDLGALPAAQFDAFSAARHALFEALAAEPQRTSVHAIAAGHCVAEATQYVAAYRDLVGELATQPRFRAEFEAVLLADTVSDPESGIWWIAPTAPLTVAYLLELAARARDWSADAAQLLDEDLRTCTPRHLLPAFHSEGTWYTAADSPAYLWRRYGPASSADPAESRPRYIAKRIRRFLDVHPAYRQSRQELAVAFVEPGDGRGPLEALRMLMRPLIKPGAAVILPRLSVTIVSSSDRPTALEEILRGSGSLASEVDRALRDRVKLQRVPSSEDLGFQHVTFVFQSSLQEEPGVVELDARATTLFVNGLAALPGRAAEVDRNETAFHWGTFAGPRTGDPLIDITRSGLELVGGMPRAPLAPGRTRMPTARVGHRFLEPLYISSAWVVHLDRLLGLEAFAPDATGAQARYLIDFEERSDPGQPGLDAITATSRINPYRLALRQALAGHGAPADPALDRILQLFNGVSGRWALDLVGATGHGLQERAGLAAALSAARDLDGWLAEDRAVGVIIPLDELIESLPGGARPRDGQRCDDLLYLRLPLKAPGEPPQPVQARLLEVKYRQASDTASAESARRQLERSYQWLKETFASEGPARAFRSRDLAELLRGAITRASSFGLLAVDSPGDVEVALGRIISCDYEFDLGYDVDGRRIYGDFVSIEPSSGTAVHRQDLTGPGLALGHVRLGKPVLEALAKGEPIVRPPGWAVPVFGAEAPPDELPPPPGPNGGDPGSGDPAPAEPAVEQVSGGEPADSGRRAAPAELGLVAGRLDAAFAKYGLSVEPFTPELAQVGPSVIRFRTRTLGRLSISEVERRARDIGREIAAPGEVHVADEPGFVTVDVPRAERDALVLADVLPALDAATSRPGALDFVVGVAPSGETRIADLSRLPHLLVAGATGSGKSVFLRGLLTELLRARTPEQLHLLIIDPKRLDFVAFTRAPHLRGGTIISDPDQAVETLQFTLDSEISLRQPLLEAAGVSSASEFYEAGGSLEDLPQLVILVDEFADLVLAGTDPRAFLDLIQRYAQLTRAYGIYLVLATQRPSVNVVTGSIKANLAARIAFSLPSARDSMTVIDQGGAEDLLGDGDLLFYRSGRTERLQAPFTSLQDVRNVLP